VSLGEGVNASTTFGGTAPLKNWEGKKRAKIGAIYDNFRVWAQISLEPMKTATKSKRRWRARSFGRWTEKILWNSVHHEQSYKRSCWPTLSRQCAFGVYQCIWVRATWLWSRENFPPSNFPQSDLGRRADSRWALPQISSYKLYFLCVLMLQFFACYCTVRWSSLKKVTQKCSRLWRKPTESPTKAVSYALVHNNVYSSCLHVVFSYQMLIWCVYAC